MTRTLDQCNEWLHCKTTEHDRDKQPHWSVEITRVGKHPCHVAFSEWDGGDKLEDFGYSTDVALGSALAQAICAVSQSDEDPWRLAVVINMLRSLGGIDQTPEMNVLFQFAEQMWESLGPDEEVDFSAWARSHGLEVMDP